MICNEFNGEKRKKFEKGDKMKLSKVEDKIEDKNVKELIYDSVVGYDEYFDAVFNSFSYDTNVKRCFSYKDLDEVKNLKSLTINHQPNLTNLNLSKLCGLEKLEICHNYNLKSVFLPFDLKNMKELSVMCNNEQVDLQGNDLVSLIKGAVSGQNELRKIKVDASFYFDIMENLQNELKNNKFAFLFNDLMVWCDNVSTFGQTELSTNQMQEYERKIESFLQSIQPLSKENQKETFAKIYAKFITTFKYDKELIELPAYRNAILQYLVNVDKGNATKGQVSAFSRLFKTNHCYDIFERKRAVCQGLSKALIMMLGKCGIKASEIVCTVSGNEYHSIVKVTLNSGGNFIVDPTCDIKSFTKMENITAVNPAIMNKYIMEKIDFNSEEFNSLTLNDYNELKKCFSSALKLECGKFKLREVEKVKREENAEQILASEFELTEEQSLISENKKACQNELAR